jgi:hypothetical protein
LADFNDVQVVVYGLAAGSLGDVAQRAKLVGVLLVGLVLEGIGVDGVEAEPQGGSPLADSGSIAGNIPGDMKGDSACGMGKGMEQAYVVEFLFQVTRFASYGKAAEAGSARTQGPTGDSYLECADLGYDVWSVYAALL